MANVRYSREPADGTLWRDRRETAGIARPAAPAREGKRWPRARRINSRLLTEPHHHAEHHLHAHGRRVTLGVTHHRATLSGIGSPRDQRLRIEREDDELGAVPVRSVEDLDPLVSEIMSDRRSWAVVALTSRHGEDRPALSPSAVRAIVGPEVPIYLICWRVTIPLQRRLPNDLHVFGGAARVWWPIFQPSPSPALHPLVYDSSGVYGQAALADLDGAYQSSRLSSRQAEPR